MEEKFIRVTMTDVCRDQTIIDAKFNKDFFDVYSLKARYIKSLGFLKDEDAVIEIKDDVIKVVSEYQDIVAEIRFSY